VPGPAIDFYFLINTTDSETLAYFSLKFKRKKGHLELFWPGEILGEAEGSL
jgi:hypothetical protein